MKKLFFTLAFASLVVVSCSKDDDDNKMDCFDCKLQGTTVKFCYTSGDDFYKMTFMGQTQEVPLNGETWEEVKEGLEVLCE